MHVFPIKANLEHSRGDTTGLMSATESIQLRGQKFLAGQGLNDDVQTGQDGVSLGQEVAIAHKFSLGNVSELAELLLVFGVSLEEAILKCRIFTLTVKFQFENVL